MAQPHIERHDEEIPFPSPAELEVVERLPEQEYEPLRPYTARIVERLFGSTEPFETTGQAEATEFLTTLFGHYDAVKSPRADRRGVLAREAQLYVQGLSGRQIAEQTGTKTVQMVQLGRERLLRDFQKALTPEALGDMLQKYRQEGGLPTARSEDRSVEQVAPMPAPKPVVERVARRAEEPVSSDPVRDYLRGIGKIPLLDAAQEVTFSKQIEAGLYAGKLLTDRAAKFTPAQQRELRQIEREGKTAMDSMVTANLRLVVSIAKRYTGRGMDFLELIQEGNAGLIHAVEMFDYQKGFKFSTYATWWIRQSITRAMNDRGRLVRLPVHLSENVVKTYRHREKMQVSLGRAPTNEELAADLGMTADKVADLISYGRDPISLNQKVGDDDSEFGDFIADTVVTTIDHEVEQRDLQSRLRDVLNTLEPREREIITRRYGLHGGNSETLEAIAQGFGLTRERVRQIELKTMQKLRQPDRKDMLQGYLES